MKGSRGPRTGGGRGSVRLGIEEVFFVLLIGPIIVLILW